MPSMAAIALDRLLEASEGRENPKASLPIRSPALYAIPDPLPVSVGPSFPSSPSSVSPSPYLVNRKGRLVKVEEKEVEQEVVVVVGDGGVRDGDGDGTETPRREGDLGGDVDDFFDPSSSVASCSSSGAAGVWNRAASVVSHSEFYDADEEFFSDSVSQSSPSFSKDFVTELCGLRLTLLEEIEKRKIAEKAVMDMQNWWRRIGESVSHMGLPLPVDHHGENVQLDADPAEIFQEIVVSKLISEQVDRGLVRAEIEAVANEVIDSKNHEISRLRDRVQYYEAVNREMYQRNQEVIELGRRKRLRRKTRQKWIWSCIGLSITVGASLLTYSYLTDSAKESMMISQDSSSGTAESEA
ncbi:uncharacterized protein [Typha latifolia]|uniref:uncharacterized protein n=1 Tax=Typha latifolia TaxID=4733 RepID=UPI003C2FA336